MQERRRIKVINRDFQYNFMLKGVLAVVISLNLIIFSVYMLDRHYGLPGTIFNVFSVSLFFMEVAAVAIVAWIGRDVSFHIAGPVYALARTLKGMATGDLTQRLTLRDGDNFTEAADTLNLLLESYQERIARMQALLSQDTLSEEAQAQLRAELAWFRTTHETAHQRIKPADTPSEAQANDWAERKSA